MLELFVDANGGYRSSRHCASAGPWQSEFGVTWFEEPVSSDDLAGLSTCAGALLVTWRPGSTATPLATSPACSRRRRSTASRPTSPAAAATPSGFAPPPLAQAHHLEISGHCAPNLHAPVAAAVPNLRHVEYFHDHHRIETMLFEGTLPPNGGTMTPDRSGPAMDCACGGDAARYRVA